MTDQSIRSEDMTLKRIFQDFYRVPDYQRDYVWGENDPKGERGDEVEQFLRDINAEYERATTDSAPEYFIGTIVVCPGAPNILDLIDGQQRTTTAFLTLCAIRDLLTTSGTAVPDELRNQIASSTVDWQGKLHHHLRLDLQYEDARGVLTHYASGTAGPNGQARTRSVTNIANAYSTIKDVLHTQCAGDPAALLRFYGYFTNKVKLIRIETASVARALKIFETINDRGVGLDAMDLLKNLLFMSATPAQFSQLKDRWKALTDTIHGAREKPLRFLRYFIFASFTTERELLEDDIYDWLVSNHAQTGIDRDPVAFVDQLLAGARAYARFLHGQNPAGSPEPGIVNTRYAGGWAFRQHFILLLAGRHLSPPLFSKLALEVEKLVSAWLIAGIPSKDYERSILDKVTKLRGVQSEADFAAFREEFFVAARRALYDRFLAVMQRLQAGDTRAYRLRYIVARLTQHLDIAAYGDTGGHGTLAHYIEGGNDIEHIMPINPCEQALQEFGAQDAGPGLVQQLGNLCLIEGALNKSLGNKPYSEKRLVYPSSQFLLTKCQGGTPPLGIADKITRVAKTIPPFPQWTRTDIEKRQAYLASLALAVWDIPVPAAGAAV